MVICGKNIPPTGFTIKAIISESAPTAPPQTGPKRAAVTKTEINLNEIFIPAPILIVP